MTIGGFGEKINLNNPYRVWHINKSNIKSDKNHKITIESVRLGYYHHRIILNVSMNFNKRSFHDLRYIRDAIHQFFRDNITDNISSLQIRKIEASSHDCRIQYVYSYPLLVIENGTKFIAEGNTYNDTVFSDATTSFLFKIPESTLIPRNHYIRVSIPSTFLYCTGKMRKGFFWNLINAIYFGGLYEKKKKERGFDYPRRKNEFDEDLLINLTRLMLEYVSEVQFSVTDIKLSLIAIIFAIIAIIASLIVN